MTIAVDLDVKHQAKPKQMDKFMCNAAVLMVFYSMVLIFIKRINAFVYYNILGVKAGYRHERLHSVTFLYLPW